MRILLKPACSPVAGIVRESFVEGPAKIGGAHKQNHARSWGTRRAAARLSYFSAGIAGRLSHTHVALLLALATTCRGATPDLGRRVD